MSQRLGQPSRSGPPVLWRGCTPEGRASLPCRHVRVGAGIVFRPDSAKRFPEGCGNGHGAGTGPAEAGQGLPLPRRQSLAVAKAGSAFPASGAWRAAARHSEQSGQILRYGLPQIKKISVFCGQGPVTALPSFTEGRAGTGQFPHGGGKSPMGWFGERREKRPRRGESPGRQRERTVRVPADRQGCRIGPRRQRSLSRRGLRRTAPCWKRERPAVCAAPKPYRVSACPGPTDHCTLVTIGDRAVVCRSSFPNKARWEGEGV